MPDLTTLSDAEVIARLMGWASHLSQSRYNDWRREVATLLADAARRLRSRGTCATCRAWSKPKHGERAGLCSHASFPHRTNDSQAVVSVPVTLPDFGCTLYQPQAPPHAE